MLQLIVSKGLNGLLTLFGVATIVFFLFHVLGDPAQMMVDQNASEAQVTKIQEKYGFNLPLHQQFLYYLNDLSLLSVHPKSPEHFARYTQEKYGGWPLILGENIIVLKWPYLRTSYQRQGKPVSTIIAETLPNTLLLALTSIGIAICLGMLLGLIAGYFKGSFIDKVLVLFSTFGMSVPSFFSAILFSWLFGHVFADYTGLNMTGSLYEMDDYGENMHLRLGNLVLPSIVLGIRPIAVIVQLVRSGLIDVMGQEYIKTAYAKGLNSFQIVYKHAIKNTLNPVITAISGWFASMLAGAVFVEYIFGWRGLGKEIVNALNTLDIPVVMGAVLVIATLFTLLNIVVDYLYHYIDPKTNPF
ncbi:MAG: ABC transporter permease [Flavobacteriaceae bacterium]